MPAAHKTEEKPWPIGPTLLVAFLISFSLWKIFFIYLEKFIDRISDNVAELFVTLQQLW